MCVHMYLHDIVYSLPPPLPLSLSLSLSLSPSLPPCRLSELVRLVSDGLDSEFSSKADRLDYGNRLKSAIANFTVDFIPHMNEEEEVCVCVSICTIVSRVTAQRRLNITCSFDPHGGLPRI